MSTLLVAEYFGQPFFLQFVIKMTLKDECSKHSLCGYIMPCVRISVMLGEGDCSVVNALTVKYCRLGRSSSRNVNVIWIGLYLSES